MRLYTNPGSSNCRRVEAVLIQLGRTDVEQVRLNHFTGEHRNPEFGAINPNYKLPALEDDGFTLWESNAIMQYLADGTALFPDDPQIRADISRWQFWTSFTLGPSTAAVVFERAFKEKLGMGAPDPALLDRELGNLETFAGVLDAHLEGRDWLVGDGLTIADFAVCAEMSFNDLGQLDFSKWKNLSAWMDRIDALPAWQQTPIQLG